MTSKFRMRWVNVYDTWQLPLGGASAGHTRLSVGADVEFVATWIKVASLSDLVKQVRAISDVDWIGLSLRGTVKSRVSGADKLERIHYVAVGGGSDDTMGKASLQVDTGGRLVGSAEKLIEKLDRVVAVELPNTSHAYDLRLLTHIAQHLPGRYADVHAVYPCTEAVYYDRQDRDSVYAAEEAAKKAQRKGIQEANLETGKLKNHLDALAGKPAAPNPLAKKTYEVVTGDTLSVIAKKVYGNPSHWKTIFDANRSIIGSDPNRLRTGMVLTV